MGAHQRGQELLLLAREAGDVGVLEHVGAMHVVLAVRDRQAESRAGARRQPSISAVVVVERPALAPPGRTGAARCASTRAACAVVDAVALHQRRHRGIARIVVAAAAEHVVEHAFAHRRLADHHALQAQRVERGFQHQHAAGDDRPAVAGQAGQVDVLDAVGLQQAVAHQRQRLGGDRALGQLHRRADLADGLVGARRAQRFLPAQRAVRCRRTAGTRRRLRSALPSSASSTACRSGRSAACWRRSRPAGFRARSPRSRGR